MECLSLLTTAWPTDSHHFYLSQQGHSMTGPHKIFYYGPHPLVFIQYCPHTSISILYNQHIMNIQISVHYQCLTLSPPSTTVVPYMQTAWIQMKRRVTRRLIQIQAVWHSGTFSPTLSDIEALWKLKQKTNLADDNLLRVKYTSWV